MPDINELHRSMGRMEAKMDAMASDIADMKPHVEDWKNTKQRGIGLAIASLFSGTAIGSFLSQIGELFK